MFVYSLETILGLIGFVLIIAYSVFIGIKTWWKQKRCAHQRYRENMACHAVCNDCGKDLGFIGAWREKQKKNVQRGMKDDSHS